MDGNGSHLKRQGILVIPDTGAEEIKINLADVNAVNKVVKLVHKIRDGEFDPGKDLEKYKAIVDGFSINSEYNAPIYIALSPVIQTNPELFEYIKEKIDWTDISLNTTHKLGKFRALVQTGLLPRDSDIYRGIAATFEVPVYGGRVSELIEPKNWLKHAIKSGLFSVSDENSKLFWEILKDRYFVTTYLTDSVLDAIDKEGLFKADQTKTLEFVENLNVEAKADKVILQRLHASGVLPSSAQAIAGIRLGRSSQPRQLSD